MAVEVIRKSQPTSAEYQDEVLTNISIAYMQDDTQHVSDEAAPIVSVEKQSDKYYVFPRNAWFRDEAQLRADATESAGGGYTLSTDTYFCDVWAFHKDIGAQLEANNREPINPRRNATQFVTQKLLLRRERAFVDTFMKTGVWGKDYTGVAGVPGANQFKQWNDYANSDPIGDVETGKDYISTLTGYDPNTLILDAITWRYLRHHPDLLGRLKSGTAIGTPELLAQLLDIERILIAKGTYATNAEGGTEAYSRIHPKGALLCYVTSSPALEVPSAMYTMAWTGYVNNAYGVTINEIPMPNLKATRIEGELAFDHKLVAADLGVWFASAVA
jgi:hypothetical protein